MADPSDEQVSHKRFGIFQEIVDPRPGQILMGHHEMVTYVAFIYSPKVRGHTRDLVELVRLETGLSHASSQSVVQTVLGYVCANFQRLDRQDLYFY